MCEVAEVGGAVVGEPMAEVVEVAVVGWSSQPFFTTASSENAGVAVEVFEQR